jgi:hypothetical protein
MVVSRGTHKVERVTVTFTPDVTQKVFPIVPSTFSPLHRSYQWHRSDQLNYMIVPKKISNAEVQVDVFLNPVKKGKLAAKVIEKAVEGIVQEKMGVEWKGLRLVGIGHPTVAKAPHKTIVRGTIEEILGSVL